MKIKGKRITFWGAIGLLFLGCLIIGMIQSGLQAVGLLPTNTPTSEPTQPPPTPTDEPTATIAPTETSTPAPTITETPIPTLTDIPTPVQRSNPIFPTALPAASEPCNCTGPDLDCGNFSRQSQAQQCFNYCLSKGMGDIFKMDNDNDQRVCESLP